MTRTVIPQEMLTGAGSRLNDLAAGLPPLRMRALCKDAACPDIHHISTQTIADAEELDLRLARWPQHLKNAYSFSKHLNKDAEGNEELPRYTHVYQNPYTAATWNYWRINRLRTLSIAEHFSRILHSQSRSKSHALFSKSFLMDELVEDIYSSVPHSSGQVLANFAFEEKAGQCESFHQGPRAARELWNTWFTLRPLDVGSPAGSMEELSCLGEKPSQWGRAYIKRYAKSPLREDASIS